MNPYLPKRITALLLAAMLVCCAGGCSSDKEESTSQQDTSQSEETAAPTSAEEVPTEAETSSPETEHVSPTEIVTSSLGTQLDVNAALNKDSEDDSQKNYKASLSALMQAGDRVESFTFIFKSDADIGTYQGGCGISVTQDCPAATDEGWYQSPDFEVQTEGQYAEVTWQVPEEIKDNISPDGDVQIGYWWGDTSTVTLTQIICNYTHTVEIPVDGTQTISVGQSLRHSSDETNSIQVPIGDVLSDTGVPQAVIFDISAGSSLDKFTGAFGITANEDMYMTDTVAVLTDASTLQLTWIIPDEIKTSIPQDAEVLFGYWWGEPEEITLQNITIKYSDGAGTSKPVSKGETTVDSGAAQIVSDIRVGWNLGNTLDCYDETNKAKNLETYWGNISTTKDMIDAVRAEGFNAIRIPVSWGNHLDSSNTIAPKWLDRVQEIVDYGIDNDMYVILNMHHDDYLWLHPVYAEEDAVREKYLTVWKQIAERFKDYDNKLLFEGMNEPRMVGTSAEWTGGTEEERDVINHLQAAFVETIRASGGNNASRTLIVTTHAASITDAAVSGLVVPDDDNLIVSIHNYAPWQFTTLEYPDAKNFEESDKDGLENQFATLKAIFIDKGIPVIIGEFGAENKGNEEERAEYYASYVSIAASYGIPCFIWDNGSEDSYGLLDRKSKTWYSDKIVDSLMDALE